MVVLEQNNEFSTNIFVCFILYCILISVIVDEDLMVD